MTAIPTPFSALGIVFSEKTYIAVAAAVGASFWLIFNYFDGLIFFIPEFIFYYPLPDDGVPGFILSNITAILVGIVVSMNVFVIKNLKLKMGKAFLSGSMLGVISSTCASCTSIGFMLITTFGTAGAATSAFLSNYQIPLRLLAIGLLIWAYYSTQKKITGTCDINSNK